jgi:hypothetical protein
LWRSEYARGPAHADHQASAIPDMVLIAVAASHIPPMQPTQTSTHNRQETTTEQSRPYRNTSVVVGCSWGRTALGTALHDIGVCGHRAYGHWTVGQGTIRKKVKIHQG